MPRRADAAPSTEVGSDANDVAESIDVQPLDEGTDIGSRARETRFFSWQDLERVADEAADIDAVVRKELQSVGGRADGDEQRPVEPEDRPRQRRPRRATRAVVALVTVAGVGGAVAGLLALDRNESRQPSATSTAAVVTPPAQPSPAQESPDVASVIHARLLVSTPCWVHAVADGRPAFTGTLTSGTRTFRARRSLVITLGNAGGVRLIVNGRDVATGSAGQVVHLSFALRDGRVVQHSAPQ